MERSHAIKNLSGLTRHISKKDIHSREEWREWVEDDQDGKESLADLLEYRQVVHAPTAGQLIIPHFHPKLPLIGWNYTKLAHNKIEFYEQIWTPVIRQCRGIVFDTDGNLIALPFEKFFNYSTGEHPETKSLPKGPFVATEKHDGDLGIVFRYRGRLHVTTRGTFDYKSAKLAEDMIANLNRRKWRELVPEGITLLVEIIHPETRKLRLYRKSELILIGAYENESLYDFDHNELRAMSIMLGIESAQAVEFGSIAELEDLVSGPTRNREGYVGRFGSRRAKFKFMQHLGRMYEAHLTRNPHGYVLKLLTNGNWDEKTAAMDEEVLMKARRIRDDIVKTATETPRKEVINALMLLAPAHARNNGFRQLCRNFATNYL